MKIQFNLNNYIYVRLNQSGIEIMRKQHENFRELLKKKLGREPDISPFKEPEKDVNGFSKFQAWDFMEIFGRHMQLGFNLPFEMDIELDVESVTFKGEGTITMPKVIKEKTNG